MPIETVYVCLRCQTEFRVPIFSIKEQEEAKKREPTSNFGPVRCKNPSCQSDDVIDKNKLS